jgi:DNA-binding MarR family transcriptional regulator
MEHIEFWRVCRVIANPTRVKMLGLVSSRPGLRVSDIARVMRLSKPAASQYLRSLEICRFVVGQRIRRSVVYELGSKESGTLRRALLRALIKPLQEDKRSPEAIYKRTAAFANPGRLEVFRRIHEQAQSVAELKQATRWTARTLQRHLRNLEARGFVRRQPGARAYETAAPSDHFARALAAVAVGETMAQHARTRLVKASPRA